MSQENVEIVRAGIDAFNRRDLVGVLKDADPDFEFDVSRAVGPVQGVFKLDQTRGLLEEFVGMWEAVRWEIDELREVGNHVAASITSYFRGRDGIEITARTPWVWTFRDAGASCANVAIRSGRTPSKTWGCRSKTFTPTPEPAGYCAGDAASVRERCEPLEIVSAALMFRRLFGAIRYAAREEGFLAVFGAAIVLVLVGTVTYSTSQSWNVVDAFYFAVCTLTTSSIADPDLTLSGEGIKVFTAFYVLTGIGILVEMARQVGFGFIKMRSEHHAARHPRDHAADPPRAQPDD